MALQQRVQRRREPAQPRQGPQLRPQVCLQPGYLQAACRRRRWHLWWKRRRAVHRRAAPGRLHPSLTLRCELRSENARGRGVDVNSNLVRFDNDDNVVLVDVVSHLCRQRRRKVRSAKSAPLSYLLWCSLFSHFAMVPEVMLSPMPGTLMTVTPGAASRQLCLRKRTLTRQSAYTSHTCAELPANNCTVKARRKREAPNRHQRNVAQGSLTERYTGLQAEKWECSPFHSYVPQPIARTA